MGKDYMSFLKLFGAEKSGKLDLLGLRKIAANVTAVGYLKTDLST